MIDGNRQTLQIANLLLELDFIAGLLGTYQLHDGVWSVPVVCRIRFPRGLFGLQNVNQHADTYGGDDYEQHNDDGGNHVGIAAFDTV